jgi:hypothetical protein
MHYDVLASQLKFFGASPKKPRRLSASLRVGMAIDKTIAAESACEHCGHHRRRQPIVLMVSIP